MDADHPALLALIQAVSDGAAVDWESAGTGASDSFRAAVADLRVVSDIVNLNRSIQGESSPDATTARLVDDAPAPVRAVGRWGHLQLLGHVASGSFGDVYRAWDPAIQREVALKLLRPATLADRGASDAIEEGRLLARVQHPNVVTIHGAARIDGRVGLWMEFVEGQTLAALVQSHGPLPIRQVLTVACELCEAVAAIHEAGLLHRDIKAQNVMLANDGRVVLMDLGAGQVVGDERRGLAGTPLYLAPELLEGGEPSVRSDVYSLGILLRYLSTGRFPAHRPGLQGTSLDRTTSDPATQARLPRALAAIVRRATAPDPSGRFPTAHALGSALRRVRERRRRRVQLAATVTAIAAVFGAGLTARRFVQTPPGNQQGAVPLNGGESSRRLPWTVSPTGAPSPDGRFVGAIDWKTDPFVGRAVVLDLATNAVQPMWNASSADHDAGAYALSSAISPDSQRIAFAWSLPGAEDATELRVCRADGSGRRTVYREPHSDLHVIGWSSATNEILARRHVPGRATDLLWVDPDDGRARPAARVPGDAFASLNPNGRDLVFDVAQPDAPAKHDLMEADLLTGIVRPILEEPEDDARPVWLPDGRHVLFASDRAGTYGAWVLDAGTARVGDPQQVRSSMDPWEPVGFGARGELYYRALTGTVDVYASRLHLDTGTTEARQPIATSFRGRNLFTDWAPDGRRVAFVSRRGPLVGGPAAEFLVVRNLASREERVISGPFSGVGPPRWAPDGNRIAVPVSAPDPALAIVDVATGRTVRSWPMRGSVSSVDWLSPDHLAVAAQEPAAGVLRVVSAASGAGRVLATAVDAVSVSHRRDRVALRQFRPGAISVVVSPVDHVSAGSVVFTMTARGPGGLQLVGWTPDDAYVVAMRPAAPGPDGQVLVGIPADGGAPVELAHLRIGDGARTFRLSPDGAALSFEAGAPAVTNWVLEHPLLER